MSFYREICLRPPKFWSLKSDGATIWMCADGHLTGLLSRPQASTDEAVAVPEAVEVSENVLTPTIEVISQDLEHSYGGNLLTIVSVATIVAHLAGLPIHQVPCDSRRSLVRWFAANWPKAGPLLQFIHLRNEFDEVVTGLAAPRALESVSAGTQVVPHC